MKYIKPQATFVETKSEDIIQTSGMYGEVSNDLTIRTYKGTVSFTDLFADNE